MKKVNLNNMYESSNPPVDINTLWVDRDETTDKIRAIHKYDTSKGEWVPDMVSVDYMAPENPDEKPVKPEDAYPMYISMREIEHSNFNISVFTGTLTEESGKSYGVYILDCRDIPDEICNNIHPDKVSETVLKYAAINTYDIGNAVPHSIGYFVDKSFVPNERWNTIYNMRLIMSSPYNFLDNNRWIIYKGVGESPYKDIQLDNGDSISNIKSILHPYNSKDGEHILGILICRSKANDGK